MLKRASLLVATPVSLAITLVFVPTIYSIVEGKLKGKRIFGKRIGGN